jgi:lambda family phage tail tape measure protein
MSELLGEGVIRVSADSTQLKAGIEDAKRSVRSLGAEVGNSVQAGATKAQRSVEAYIKRVEFSAATVGKSVREVKLLEFAQRGATEDQIKRLDAAFKTVEAYKAQASETQRLAALGRPVAQQLAASDRAMRGLAQGTKLTAQESAQLAFQLNDLFVQIASGGSPLLALVQQGSQLNGTFGGFRGTLRALGSVITPVRVALAGVAGAVGALAIGFAKGNSESAALNRSLAATGNAAGLTEGRFNSLARSIADNTNTSIGSAREAFSSLAGSGRLSGQALESAGTAVQLLSKVTGESASDIAKDFAKAADAPSKFAEELNKTYNFLSAAQLKYIKELEDQGNTQRALLVTFDALNGRLSTASKNVGILEEAWGKLKRAASEGVNFVLNIGRAETPEDTLTSLRRQLSERQSRGPLNSTTSAAFEKGNAALREQIGLYESIQREEQKLAEKSAERAAREKALSTFDKLREQTMSQQARLAKELADANSIADKAGLSQSDRASVLEGIRKKYQTATTAAREFARAQLEADLAGIRRSQESAQAQLGRSLDELEARRSAGLVNERAYYDERRKLIQQDAQAQVTAIRSENDRLSSEKIVAKTRDELQARQLERATQIADNEARAAIIRADAQSKLTVLDLQQSESLKKLELSYLSAKAAQEEYLAGLIKAQSIETDSAGLGDRERERLQGRQQILDKYAQQRLQLESDKRQNQFAGTFDDVAKAQYDRNLELINQFQGKALASFDGFYARRLEQERDWTLGARDALNNYLDGIDNVSAQAEQLFTNAFQGMEDALVQFVQTGKLNFSDLATSIVADINRIIIKQQITKPLAEWLLGSTQPGATGVQGGLGKVLGAVLGGGKTPFGEVAGIPVGGAAGAFGKAAETTALTTAITTSEAASSAAITAAIGASSATETAALTATYTTITTTATAALTAAISASSAAIVAAIAAGKAGDAASGLATAAGGSDFFTSFGGFFADGGTPPLGKVSVVGERGPELFVPKSLGTIVPLDKTAAPNKTIAPTIVVQQSFAPGTDRRTINQAASATASAAQTAMARFN